MRCMPWPTHGSGCGEEREAPEYLELARGGRGRGAGARRRRGAATTRASDRAGAAVLPPPDGRARRVRAHLLCDHRHRRTCHGTVPTVLPDRYRTPQPPALRAVSPRHRPAQSRRVEPGRVRRTRVARHRGRGDARGRHRRHRGRWRRGLFPALGGHHTHAARRRGPRHAAHFRLADGRGAVGAHRTLGPGASDRTHRLVRDQPAGARGSAQSARARVRGRGAGAGRGCRARYLSSRPSQRGGPDHRLRGPRHRPHDAARGRAFIPRDGRPLPDAQLGQHDRRRLAQDGRRLVVGDVSRTGDLARGDGAERCGRRAARRARSPQGGGVTEPLLRVRDLKTYFVTEQGSGTARAVDGVSFEVQPGETLGIVGESGCGKTVTSLSILRLIPEPPGHIRPGSFIEFEGRNLLTLEPRDLRAIRGNQIAMIFQEPMTSLNPVFTVGDQIAEAAIVHQRLSRRAARTRAIEMLRLVGIPDPEERVDHYPHQMSGGMRQRVMIAMALVCHPKLLIADEPTTALDVTIQAQILELLDRLQAELGMAVMLITHDLGVVAGSANPARRGWRGRPRHPHGALLAPHRPAASHSTLVTPPLVDVQGLVKHFPGERGLLGLGRPRAVVRAVDDVSFAIAPGQTLGLVGESGCGKSTVGRAILRLIEPDAGRVTIDGQDVVALGARPLRVLRRRMQIVFQDPYGSLNPRMTVHQMLAEPLAIHRIARGADAERRIGALLEEVGLDPSFARSYPHELSGGQRQRVGIARALSVEPHFLVLDEPVSALDVSVQAQVLNLLAELQQRRRLTYLFIAHDLAVVKHIADHVAVMYLGKIVERAPAPVLYAGPRHPYTTSLLSAVPVPDPKAQRQRIVLAGDVPSPAHPPPGCPFHPRCPHPRQDTRS